MDVIVTGTSSASKKKIDRIVTILKDLFQANQSDFLNKKISFDKIMENVNVRWKSIEYEIVPKEEEVHHALIKL